MTGRSGYLGSSGFPNVPIEVSVISSFEKPEKLESPE